MRTAADAAVPLRTKVEGWLDEAEEIWEKTGEHLRMRKIAKALVNEAFIQSPIPGHPLVKDGEVIQDHFIALVADVRGSSSHLFDDCSLDPVQRVFYEMRALLPALADVISGQNGQVTEYLGDGVLAFFRVEGYRPNPEDPMPLPLENAIRNALDAARHCVGEARETVNDAISFRYDLPALSLGVGLSFSPALVLPTGLDGAKQVKVYGPCVWQATKLSDGDNEIKVHASIESVIPAAPNGKLRFKPATGRGNVNGFSMTTLR